jgi:hypothetical protein
VLPELPEAELFVTEEGVGRAEAVEVVEVEAGGGATTEVAAGGEETGVEAGAEEVAGGGEVVVEPPPLTGEPLHGAPVVRMLLACWA